MGHKSSINFKPVKPNSQSHNERIGELDYVYSDLTNQNETWKTDEIHTRFKSIADLYKEKVGQKMQANSTPIREAVVNLSSHHTMKDLQRFSKEIEDKFGIKAFQIHIHRDEGKSREELNHHAHILWDWQNKDTGRSFKLYKHEMSQIQDLTAESLGMERGESKVNTNRDRLEAVEYKTQQETKKLSKLQEQVEVLEQKKNEAQGRHDEAEREHQRAEKEHGEVESDDRKVGQELSTAMEQESRAREQYEGLENQLREIRERNKGREKEIDRYREVATILKERPDAMADFSEEEINGAIQYLEKEIRGVEEENSKLEEEYSNAQDDWRRKRNSD